MIYVLQERGTGKYVARQGSPSSYTLCLAKARAYLSEAAAEADRCGNETIVLVSPTLAQIAAIQQSGIKWRVSI